MSYRTVLYCITLHAHAIQSLFFAAFHYSTRFHPVVICLKKYIVSNRGNSCSLCEVVGGKAAQEAIEVIIAKMKPPSAKTSPAAR